MQSRYRNPRDGFRPAPSANSGSRIPSYSRDLDRGAPNPHAFSRKIDILMEAGRLAAGYLASRGVIPPEILRRKFPNGSPPGFERQVREIPPIPEVRASALSRLGQRFDDEGRFGSRRRENSRKRPGPYSRVYDSDWGRDGSKSRHWIDKGRGYSDVAEEEDDFAPGFNRNQRKGYVEIKSSVSVVSADEQPTRSGSTSEKENCELADDNWSKASSSSNKKDQLPETDEGSSRGVDEVRVSSSEITEEVKSERSVEPEKVEFMEEDMNSERSAEGDTEMGDCKDLLKLCSFTRVPTKPRSSLANKSPNVHHDTDVEMNNSVEDAGEEESKNLDSNEIGCSELDNPENHMHLSFKSLDEDATLHSDQFQSSVDSGTCIKSMSETKDTISENEIDGRMENDNSFPSKIPDTIEQTDSLLLLGKSIQDKVMVKESTEVVLNSTAFISKEKIECTIMIEEDTGHETSASFKICDLNLNRSPEMSEIPGGPTVDHFPSSSLVSMDQGASANLSMSMENVDNDCNNCQISVHNKVVPIIDLEDSHPDANTFDSPKHKSDLSYPILGNVLNHVSHSDDLPGIQDGYSLEFSEFLGSDISGCASAQGDLNHLQPGMGLHGTEGYPGVDDPIYVSLDELPIGFMGVWDQPSQDYGKFF